MTPEHLRLWRAEQAADAARRLADRLETERGSGVAWSGLAAAPFPGRSSELLMRDAAQRLADLEAWRASRSGRLLAAVARAERAVEATRACVARGLAASDARCGLAVGDLERAAARARAAMDVTASGALSDGDVQ